jgi:hypothetical protein
MPFYHKEERASMPGQLTNAAGLVERWRQEMADGVKWLGKRM